MERLEKSDSHPDIIAAECYEHFGLLRGLYENKSIPGGYYAQFVHKKIRYLKHFNKQVPDVNRQNAIAWMVKKRREISKKHGHVRKGPVPSKK